MGKRHAENGPGKRERRLISRWPDGENHEKVEREICRRTKTASIQDETKKRRTKDIVIIIFPINVSPQLKKIKHQTVPSVLSIANLSLEDCKRKENKTNPSTCGSCDAGVKRWSTVPLAGCRLTLETHADSVGFSPIVDERFLEPRMLQGLLGRDPLLGVVDKDLLEEVQEETIELGVGRDELLQRGINALAYTTRDPCGY